MQTTLTCHSCGTVLGIPKSGVPADGIACNWCGAFTHPKPPSPEPSGATATVATKPASKSSSKSEKPKPPPRRWADDEDDDGLPYDVPADAVTTKPCAACQKKIAIDSVVCLHCGHDHRKQTKAERVYSPIDKEWEQGWPFSRRLAVFLSVQVVNLLTLGVGIFASDTAIPALVATVPFVILQAFLIGTYPRLRVRRNKKGQAEITNTWRFCFVPLQTKKIDWRSHEGVSVGAYDGSGFMSWWIFVSLLSAAIIPAILWWWYDIRSDRFFTALTIQSGAPETYLYRGLREEVAKEIAQTITDATGLTLNTPL